jgi:hypothetical protein
MANLSLRIDVAQLAQTPNILKTDLLARMDAAVEHVCAVTAERWQAAVAKAKIAPYARQAYIDSISFRMVGTLKGEVSADYGKAREIEEGQPARDLKRMLDTSLKVRVNKQGKRYLIIPFRHNTPGYTAHSSDMPDHVYAAASKLAPSKITSMGSRISGTGAWDVVTKGPLKVKQANYLWGGRLRAGSMGPNQKGRSDRFAGMVRFQEMSGKTPKSVYMTFRTMVEGSPGWIIKAQPGLYIAKGVIDAMKPDAMAEFKAAAQGLVL